MTLLPITFRHIDLLLVLVGGQSLLHQYWQIDQLVVCLELSLEKITMFLLLAMERQAPQLLPTPGVPLGLEQSFQIQQHFQQLDTVVLIKVSQDSLKMETM